MKTEHIHIRIEPELKKELEKTAKKMRLSLAQFMIIASIEKASKVQKSILEEDNKNIEA